jgi:pimeloyl-ACP methyl ester carboxylesterase
MRPQRHVDFGPPIPKVLAVTSEKSPLVLLHPVTSSGRIWQDVVPLLSEYHEVHAPTLLGHRGGPAIQRRPVRVSDMVDAAERYLDEHGLARPHLAGNSLGGWVAIELARRGRAASVCAFSPAGFCGTAILMNGSSDGFAGSARKSASRVR